MTIEERAAQLVSKMTLKEKARMCAGKDFWTSASVERLGLRSILMTDGPHGLRKQTAEADQLGINDSLPAACFPAACATACSFDHELLRDIGRALGDKCVREDVSVILGPGVNIKRSPLCGRNFEYFSEDPCVAGELSAAMIEGVQSRGVGVSIKHFAANNQETNRMTCDSVVDTRALREIYLTAFETAVKKADPWTVMCSYNLLRGEYVNESKWLLGDVLRGEWGYKNLVVSDWGAVSDRIRGIRAGLDLEMPNSGPDNEKAIIKAVRKRRLSVADLDQSARRVVELILKAQERRQPPESSDEADDRLAARAAAESAVLLKNNGALPIKEGASVAFIGRFAETPRYQGAGSSRINPTRLSSPLEAAREAGLDPSYAEGYSADSRTFDETLLRGAVETAKAADVAVVFAGLPDEYESEGFDRTTMAMPESHVRLIEEVSAVNPSTVVVLMCGSPVETGWRDRPNAILLCYLSGQAVGRAAVELLWGQKSPGGRLAETWPERVEDSPSAAYFPGRAKAVEYRESLFVGYRYYDAAGVRPAYPFGCGLSYTSFSYGAPTVEKNADCEFTVSVEVTNSGGRAGSETVLFYVGKPDSRVIRAPKELRGFEKLSLAPGESRTVSFKTDRRSFAYFNTAENDYRVEGGEYTLYVGGSNLQAVPVELVGDGKDEAMARQKQRMTAYAAPCAPFSAPDDQFVELLGYAPPTGERDPKAPFTTSSTLEDISETKIGKTMINKSREHMAKAFGGEGGDPTMLRMAEAMLMTMPLRAMKMAGTMTGKQVDGIVDMSNGHTLRGILKMAGK